MILGDLYTFEPHELPVVKGIANLVGPFIYLFFLFFIIFSFFRTSWALSFSIASSTTLLYLSFSSIQVWLGPSSFSFFSFFFSFSLSFFCLVRLVLF